MHNEAGGDFKTCVRCGKLMPAGAAFCNSCGADLNAAPSPGLRGAVDPADFKSVMGAEAAPAPRAFAAPPQGQPSPISPGPYPAFPATPAYGLYPPLYRQRKTDDLAIASLVCAVASFTVLPFFAAVAAIATGFVSRERISKSEGLLEGNGLALTGILVGLLNLVLCVAILLAALLVFPST